MTSINAVFKDISFKIYPYPFSSLGANPQFVNKYAQDFAIDVNKILLMFKVTGNKQWILELLEENKNKIPKTVLDLMQSDGSVDAINQETLQTLLSVLQKLLNPDVMEDLIELGQYCVDKQDTFLQDNRPINLETERQAKNNEINKNNQTIAANESQKTEEEADKLANIGIIAGNDTLIEDKEKERDDLEVIIDGLQAIEDANELKITEQETEIDAKTKTKNAQLELRAENIIDIAAGDELVLEKQGEKDRNDETISGEESEKTESLQDKEIAQGKLDGYNTLKAQNAEIIAGLDVTIESNNTQIKTESNSIVVAEQSTSSSIVGGTHASIQGSTSISELQTSLPLTSEQTFSSRNENYTPSEINKILTQEKINTATKFLVLSFYNSCMSGYFLPEIAASTNLYPLLSLDLNLSGNCLSFLRNTEYVFAIKNPTADADFDSLGSAIGSEANLLKLILCLSDLYLSPISMNNLTKYLRNLSKLQIFAFDARKSTKTSDTTANLITNLKAIGNTLEQVSISMEKENSAGTNSYVSAFSKQTNITSFTLNMKSLVGESASLANDILSVTTMKKLKKLVLILSTNPNTMAYFNSSNMQTFTTNLSTLQLEELCLDFPADYTGTFNESIETLPGAIATQTALKKLEMNFLGSVLTTGLQSLFESLSFLTELTVLTIGPELILELSGENVIDSLGNSLLSLPLLAEFQMTINFMNADPTEFLLGLKSLINLRILTLGNIRLPPTHQQKFSDAFAALTKMEEITFRLQIYAGDLADSSALNAMSQYTKLKKFCMIATEINSPTINDTTNLNAALTNIIQTVGGTIQSLNIDCELDNSVEFTTQELTSFSMLSQLRECIMSYNQGTRHMWQELQSFSNSVDLEKIYLDSNATMSSVNTLLGATSLKLFKKLKWLALPKNISDPVLAETLDESIISPYLEHFSNIEEGIAYAGDGGYLANILQRSSNLNSMGLDLKEQYTLEDFEALLEILPQKKLVECELILGNNQNIEDDVLGEIFQDLEMQLPFLQKLQITFLKPTMTNAFTTILQFLQFSLLITHLEIQCQALSLLASLEYSNLISFLKAKTSHSEYGYLKCIMPANIDATSKANFTNFNIAQGGGYIFLSE